MSPLTIFLPGLVNLISELPFIGQAFQFNTGPKRMDWDFAPEPDRIREKIFLSRGIYGGDKWGQDTGLWAAWTRAAYPDYDVYSPPYRHGTITDVLWSMFNLSHGPGYSEAAYIMRHAGQADRLYYPATAAVCNGAPAPHAFSQTMGTPYRKCLAWPAPMSAKPMWTNVFPTPFIFS